MEQYNQWGTTSYTPIDDNDMESSHTLTSELITPESGTESNKSNFYISEHQS